MIFKGQYLSIVWNNMVTNEYELFHYAGASLKFILGELKSGVEHYQENLNLFHSLLQTERMKDFADDNVYKKVECSLLAYAFVDLLELIDEGCEQFVVLEHWEQDNSPRIVCHTVDVDEFSRSGELDVYPICHLEKRFISNVAGAVASARSVVMPNVPEGCEFDFEYDGVQAKRKLPNSLRTKSKAQILKKLKAMLTKNKVCDSAESNEYIFDLCKAYFRNTDIEERAMRLRWSHDLIYKLTSPDGKQLELTANLQHREEADIDCDQQGFFEDLCESAQQLKDQENVPV